MNASLKARPVALTTLPICSPAYWVSGDCGEQHRLAGQTPQSFRQACRGLSPSL